MAWEPIRKDKPPGAGHNLADYGQAVSEFSWAAVQAELAGLPGGRGINIAYEAVDRHAAGPHAELTALRCIARDGRVTNLTYADLRRQTSRFANVLRELGVAGVIACSRCWAGCRSCTSRRWAR